MSCPSVFLRIHCQIQNARIPRLREELLEEKFTDKHNRKS